MMDALIRTAITEKRLVGFDYHGHSRVCEPHVYGRQSGCDQLLVYQVGGTSQSGLVPDWRRMKLPEVRGLRLLDDHFPGVRPCPTGLHSSWDQTYLIVT